MSNVLPFSSFVSTTNVVRLGRKELTSRRFTCQCSVGEFSELGGRIAKQSLQLSISIEPSVVVGSQPQVRQIHISPCRGAGMEVEFSEMMSLARLYG